MTQLSDAQEPTNLEVESDAAQTVSKGSQAVHTQAEKRTKPRPGSLMDLLFRLDQLI
jgi:hypothetical protein